MAINLKDFGLENNSEIKKILEVNKEKEGLIEYIFNLLKHYKMDANSYLATALFVIYPKDEIDYELISKTYNEDVSHMLKRLNAVGFKTSDESDLEYVRNMFISMAKDIRVMIILLSYNLFLAENLNEMENPEKTTFARTVKDIYAPLSARLGLREIKNKMEDISFRFFDPEMYNQLSIDDRLNKEERQKQINICIDRIKSGLNELGIEGDVYGREKHLASVYNKLKEKQTTLSQIYDLMAVRVIVSTVEECYMVLGKINSIFTIIPNRFKDYIATPKPNGYKSIHTCVLSENNRPIEVQIRTLDMHNYNEYGVAAHWIYKDKSHKKNEFDSSISWLKQIIDENKDLSDKEFVETVSRDMFSSEIFAQTPNGKIIKFPQGANCIDFAYAIHTDIGNRCVGAKINGKFVPIVTPLANGDVCEIILGANNKAPSRDWLNIVKTAGARAKINSYFKKQFVEENIRNGKSAVENILKTMGYAFSDFASSEKLQSALKHYNVESLEELFALVGNGAVKTENLVNRVVQQKATEPKQYKSFSKPNKKQKNSILVGSESGMLTHFAKCCMPASNDEIVGYLSTGRGVMIHRKDCSNVKYLNALKLVDVEWDKNVTDEYQVRLKIEFKDDAQISKIVQILEKLGVKLLSIDIAQHNTSIVNLVIMVKRKEDIEEVKNKIMTLKIVAGVTRI